MTEEMTNNPVDNTPPIDSNDAAWVTILSTLPVNQVKQIMSDIEVVFRLNPFYYFDSWEKQDNRYQAKYRNLSNNQTIEQTFHAEENGNELTITYENGLKSKTIVRVEPGENGSKITLIDDYSGMSEAERKQHAEMADRSLQKWGEAIFSHLNRIRRWSWIPGWRSYMRRIWIPLNPSGRRVVWMLYIITLAEFAFILLLVAIWAIEQTGTPAGL